MKTAFTRYTEYISLIITGNFRKANKLVAFYKCLYKKRGVNCAVCIHSIDLHSSSLRSNQSDKFKHGESKHT